MSERDDTIAGLRALADLLDGRPDLPVPWQIRAAVGISAATDDQQRAEVDRIAMALGTEARWAGEKHTHYEAERSFGGGVEYAALAITSAHMEAWREHMDKFDHGAGAVDA